MTIAIGVIVMLLAMLAAGNAVILAGIILTSIDDVLWWFDVERERR